MDNNLIETRVANYKKGSADFQQRRHEHWRENYSLYRDSVTTNRLTQRQSVNVPLMKETIKTILAKTDEFPDIYFESLEGDKQKEIFFNEYWKYSYEVDKIELKDIVDKKQVCLYGRSFMKLNIWDGRITTEVLEPYDVLIDRYADPADIDGTANYLCHRNIFRTISAIQANKNYDEKAVASLKLQYAQSLGLRRAEGNFSEMQSRDQRMQDLGVWDTESPTLGEAVLEINEHYIRLFDDETKSLKIWVRVTCDSQVLLFKKLEEILGINFFPFVTWADDVERTDVWSDGIADIVRTPNKVLNAWFSQLVENRTLRNFGMTFYDSTQGDGKWIPQTYEPAPFGWYPVAGNPNNVTKRIDIPDLSESMDEMNFIIGMTERATASTSTEKGVPQKGDVTLGEIKIINANANERITSMAKFYRIARKELGEKFYEIAQANSDKLKPVELYKKSHKGNYFTATIKPSDWKSEAGYSCKVVSTAERDQKNIEAVQKLTAVAAQFPNNTALKSILQKKMLDLVELSSEEIDEVLQIEKQANVPPPPAAPAAPSPVDLALQQQTAALAGQ